VVRGVNESRKGRVSWRGAFRTPYFRADVTGGGSVGFNLRRRSYDTNLEVDCDVASEQTAKSSFPTPPGDSGHYFAWGR
jgi:hypothetical protein